VKNPREIFLCIHEILVNSTLFILIKTYKKSKFVMLLENPDGLKGITNYINNNAVHVKKRNIVLFLYYSNKIHTKKYNDKC
jgi:hypothetical protein